MPQPARNQSSAARPPVPGWLVPLLILFALIYPTHAFEYYTNVNEAARIYLVMAAVDHHVLHIDDGIRKFGDVHDKAEHDGHFYCDKPVGLSLLATPVYLALKAVGGLTGHAWTYSQLRYLFTVFTISLPTVILGIGLRRYWRDLTGDLLLADFSLIAYSLGTIAYPYSTQFMGHQLAAILAGAHFLLSRKSAWNPTWTRIALLGLLAGFGAITDYFSSFMHLFIMLTYVRRVRPLHLWAVWFTTALVGVAPLLIYNTMCFGGPLKMAYANEALGVFKELHSTGFMGVTYPRLESIWGLLFSPSKGLLYLCPILLFAIVGVFPGLRSSERRPEWVAVLLCVAAIVYLAFSLQEWRAGWTVGPRHMVSMLPFLMTLVVKGISDRPELRPWMVVLTLLSIALVAIPTLTMPAFEVNIENPVSTQSIFLLTRGSVTPNLGTPAGLRGALSLLPPALLLVAVLAALARAARRAGRRLASWPAAAATSIGIVWFACVATYEPDHPALRSLLRGRILGLRGEFQDSSRLLEQAIDIYPARELVQEAVPQLLLNYRQLGDDAAALRLEEKLHKIETGELRPKQLGL